MTYRRMERKKAVGRMSIANLEAMHTGSLLTRLQKLRECEESFADTDLTETEIESLKNDGRIHVKETKEWKAAYRELKTTLDGREHRR